METKLTSGGIRFSAKWAIALILLLAAIPVLAQVPTATVLGTVNDSSGAVVPGATVTIQNVDTNATRTATTADDGSYRVPVLPVGNYTVRVEKTGFGTQTRQGITLNVDQNAVINFSMTVGTSAQTVTVTAEAPQVNTTNGELGGLVNEQQMAELPLNGRNYIDLSLMQAGVTQDKNFGTGVGQVGTSYSANGATVRSNYFTLDGAPTGTLYGRNPATQSGDTMGVDGIKEYKVITNNFAAEYGMTMGSQLVMVSKNGTNRMHGDAFEYARNSIFDARNFFDKSAVIHRRLPGFERNNFGGSFGGPIRKDKTFFYAVYEGLRQIQGQSNTVTVVPRSCIGAAGATISSTTCSALSLPATPPAGCTATTSGSSTGSCVVYGPTAALMANPILFPQANFQNATDVANGATCPLSCTGFTYPGANRDSEDYGQIRVDENFSDKDTGFVRYTIGNGFVNNTATQCCQLTEPTRNQFLSLVENHIISTSLLNTARASFSRTAFDVQNVTPGSLVGPLSMIPGLSTGALAIPGFGGILGSNASVPSFGKQNIYTVSDDVAYTRGKHAYKFGTLMNRYEIGIQENLAWNGRLNFSNLTNFIVGIPSLFEYDATGTTMNRDFVWDTFGFYAQDDYRATSRLTINMGLRYEFMTQGIEKYGKQSAFRDYASDQNVTLGPDMRNRTKLNFSPRIGFAWDVTGKGTTSVRGGAGVYYDVGNIAMVLANGALSFPPFSATVDAPNKTKQFTLPFANLLNVSQAFATGGVAVSGPVYNAYRPNLWVYNLAIEHQLPGKTSLSVAYAGSRGAHMWGITDAEPAIPTVVGGVRYWNGSSPVPNPAIGSTATMDTSVATWYNSLQVVVNKRLGHGLQFQAAYTYALLLDETQGQDNLADCSVYPPPGLSGGTDPAHPLTDKGPACFDIKHNLRFNLIYHFPNTKSNGFLSKFTNGWWMGNIVSVQSGYAFTPVSSSNRSNSNVLQGQYEYLDYNKYYVPAGGTDPLGNVNNTPYNFIPFNKKTVITGNPNQWYNPLMFALPPTYYQGTTDSSGNPFPALPGCSPSNGGCYYGQLGHTGRNTLRGPGFGEWNFSIVKDTAIHALGEQGSLQFRVETFNLLNRANFGMPDPRAFTGNPVDTTPYSESPLGNVGQITTTSGTSRQIQFALKLIF